MALTQVTSAGLKDGEIVNADLSGSAAIALSKLGTSGTAGSGNFLRGDGAWTAIDLTALSASNLTSGTVPDARFPSTLPAASGANLTALNASNISSGTLAAARLDTATTQSASNNSTKIATTAYADTAIANLVDSSPSALNTLNELAAALGDDANFSTTVTNSIATKLPLAGGTLTGNVGTTGDIYIGNSAVDAKSIWFGLHNDLRIIHDGSHSYINHSGTGSVFLQTSGGFYVQKVGTTERLINATSDGNVELFYDGSKKLYTHSAGVSIDGNLSLTDADSREIRLGASSDLKIFHNGTRSKIQNLTGDLRICSNAIQIKNYDDDETYITCADNGSVELYYDNVKTVETVPNGLRVNGGEGEYAYFYLYADEGDDNADKWRTEVGSGGAYKLSNYAGGGWENSLVCNGNGSVDLYYDNGIKFQTKSDGVKLYQGHFYADNGSRIKLGDSQDLEIYHDGTKNYIKSVASTNTEIWSDTFYVKSVTGSGEAIIKGSANGAVELYHDNLLRISTHPYGATIKAPADYQCEFHLQSDNADDNDDLWQIMAGNGGWRVLNFASGSWETNIKTLGNGAVELYHNNSNKLTTTSDGVDFGIGGNNDILCISGQTIHRSGGAGCGLHFTQNAIYPTNAAASIANNLVALGSPSYKFNVGYFNQLHVEDRVLNHLKPYANDTYDLGSSTYRWRNVYTGDLHLSNESSEGNSVDGTTGNYTIQEGQDDLFLVNNRTGKKYKFALQEVS